MNDMTFTPRHRQKPITIRSDRAALLLAKLAGNGRSQAQIIEDALALAVENKPRLSRDEFIARIDAIVRPGHGRPGRSREEIEAEMYDENGLPR